MCSSIYILKGHRHSKHILDTDALVYTLKNICDDIVDHVGIKFIIPFKNAWVVIHAVVVRDSIVGVVKRDAKQGVCVDVGFTRKRDGRMTSPLCRQQKLI